MKKVIYKKKFESMKSFYFVCKDLDGKRIKVFISALNEKDAWNRLLNFGIRPF
jgi:hypothetical protein